MRRVLRDCDEVAHYWANRVQDTAYTSSRNASFLGDNYKSYSTVIAKLVEGKDGKDVAVISTHRYSMTTKKHQAAVRSATRHLRQLFVPLADDPYRCRTYVLNSIKSLKIKASAARTNRAHYLATIRAEISEFNEYAELVGLDPIPMPEISSDELAQIAKDQKERRKIELAQEKERARIAALEFAERLVLWRKGEVDYLPYQAQHLKTMLRVKYDEIQTSRSARIPVADAIRLWPFILRVMHGDKDYDVGMQLGVYRLTKIRTNGSIVVGCHDIPFDEIEKIAEQLNLTGETHDDEPQGLRAAGQGDQNAAGAPQQ